MLFRLLTLTVCLLYGTLIAWGAHAAGFEKGDMLLRARIAGVVPDTKGTLVPIGGRPYVSPTLIPEIDFSYFINDNISAEMIFGLIPHKAKALGTRMGDRDGGRILAIAPTVLLKFHKPVSETVIPYVGAGIAYVKYIANDKVDQMQYTDDVAAVAQIGLDVMLNDKWSANIDIKKAWVGTKAKINGGRAYGDMDINPVVYGVGIGYKF